MWVQDELENAKNVVAILEPVGNDLVMQRDAFGFFDREARAFHIV